MCLLLAHFNTFAPMCSEPILNNTCATAPIRAQRSTAAIRGILEIKLIGYTIGIPAYEGCWCAFLLASEPPNEHEPYSGSKKGWNGVVRRPA